MNNYNLAKIENPNILINGEPYVLCIKNYTLQEQEKDFPFLTLIGSLVPKDMYGKIIER